MSIPLPDSSPSSRVIEEALFVAVMEVVNPFSDTGAVASNVPSTTNGSPSDTLMVTVLAPVVPSANVCEYLIHATWL